MVGGCFFKDPLKRQSVPDVQNQNSSTMVPVPGVFFILIIANWSWEVSCRV